MEIHRHKMVNFQDPYNYFTSHSLSRSWKYGTFDDWYCKSGLVRRGHIRRYSCPSDIYFIQRCPNLVKLTVSLVQWGTSARYHFNDGYQIKTRFGSPGNWRRVASRFRCFSSWHYSPGLKHLKESAASILKNEDLQVGDVSSISSFWNIIS